MSCLMPKEYTTLVVAGVIDCQQLWLATQKSIIAGMSILWFLVAMPCSRCNFQATAMASFEYRGSEIDAPQINHYDLVFTSPPYYKIEKYHGDNQSFRKYKACDEWLEGFLFPMISHAWNSVEHGGHVLMNISDCYVNHTYNKLCMPLIEHCLE
jgi:hypothetical protein